MWRSWEGRGDARTNGVVRRSQVKELEGREDIIISTCTSQLAINEKSGLTPPESSQIFLRSNEDDVEKGEACLPTVLSKRVGKPNYRIYISRECTKPFHTYS